MEPARSRRSSPCLVRRMSHAAAAVMAPAATNAVRWLISFATFAAATSGVRVLVKRPSAAVYTAADKYSTCLAWRSVLALLCDADRRVLQFAKALIRASHV